MKTCPFLVPYSLHVPLLLFRLNATRYDVCCLHFEYTKFVSTVTFILSFAAAYAHNESLPVSILFCSLSLSLFLSFSLPLHLASGVLLLFRGPKCIAFSRNDIEFNASKTTLCVYYWSKMIMLAK